MKQRPGDQPLPRFVEGRSVQQAFRDMFEGVIPSAIIEYSHERERVGIERYGQALHPFNGRDVFQDAFEEAFDLLMYLIQMQMEGFDASDLIHTVVDVIVELWAIRPTVHPS